MKQKCEFSYNSHSHGAVINISIDENFSEAQLFEEIGQIPNLQVINREMTHQSFGPAETWYDIKTSQGTFSYEAILEGLEEGYSVYSSDKALMELIVKQLRRSEFFTEIAF